MPNIPFALSDAVRRGDEGLLPEDYENQAYTGTGDIRSVYALVEIQGVVEGEAEGLGMGTVSFDASNTPWLVVGRHRLRGKRVALDKPFGVLRKSDKVFVAVLKYKYLFNERPELVLAEHNIGLPALAKRKS